MVLKPLWLVRVGLHVPFVSLDEVNSVSEVLDVVCYELSMTPEVENVLGKLFRLHSAQDSPHCRVEVILEKIVNAVGHHLRNQCPSVSEHLMRLNEDFFLLVSPLVIFDAQVQASEPTLLTLLQSLATVRNSKV